MWGVWTVWRWNGNYLVTKQCESKVLIGTVYWWSLTSYSHVEKHQITPEFVVTTCV